MNFSSKRAQIAAVFLLCALGLGLRLFMYRHNWVFAGSDSYGYVKLADEWRAHGRYALGPAPEPLHFARVPAYPAFVALVKGGARAEMMGGDGWGRITTAQSLVDVFLTGLLVFFVARKLSGPVAGLFALALALFWPPTVLAAGAALTECLAAAFTTAAVAALILGRARPRLWFAVAGGLTALSALVRPDGILLAFAFVPALWQLAGGWRERARVGALALAGFLVVFAPWPIRNLVQFGHAYPLGTRVDRSQHAVTTGDGPHHWLASWGRDWETFNWGASCVFERGCAIPLQKVEDGGGFDGPEDRAALGALLQQRAREGVTESVSRGFDELAAQKRRRHPFKVLVWLPLRRAVQMWTDSFDEIFQRVPVLYGATRPVLPALTIALFVVLLVGGGILLRRSETRAPTQVLLFTLLMRTAVLAITFYVMPRYLRQVLPLAYVIVGAGLVEAARLVLARRRRAT